ncbi:Acetolactate synthase isozyme 2 large subunit [Hafnia alvei]|uniref:Acetolactate synthase isozyme 2 large subunit n=1 Tax=Hafnia alvei TaxID=569 RepID=A0A377PBH3_HAFAL|nr:Acetolactate synthase isozyme 2 large subunit [Hafnia alvei]
MNGAQWVVQALRAQGVDKVFGYPGGAIMPVYDALYDGGVEHLLCRHEQGAVIAAIVMPALRANQECVLQLQARVQPT